MSAIISNQPIIGTQNFLDCAGRAQRRQRFWARGGHSRFVSLGAGESGVALCLPPQSKTVAVSDERAAALGEPQGDPGGKMPDATTGKLVKLQGFELRKGQERKVTLKISPQQLADLIAKQQ